MNNPYVIVTESSCNLPKGLIEQHQLQVISMTFIIGGEEYLSYNPAEEVNLREVYGKMRQKMPIKTSSVNAESYRKAFVPHLSNGTDILYIGFSSGLSASYSNAVQTIETLRTEFPARTIYCIDSLCACLGQGRLVMDACERKESGADIHEVYDWVKCNKLRVRHMFTVESLFYLYQGGRVSKSKHLLADTLNIKPVMHVNNSGHLVPTGKAFGRKASLAALVNRLLHEIHNPAAQTIYIGHGDCFEDVDYVIKRISDRITVKGFVVNQIDMVIGAHSGPGTIAIFYTAEGDREGAPLPAKTEKLTTAAIGNK